MTYPADDIYPAVYPAGATTTPPPDPSPTLTPAQVRNTLIKRGEARKRQQRARPELRLFDTNWDLYCILWGEIEASFEEKLNDTGEASLRLFGQHKVRDWLLKEVAEAQDVHVTMQTPGYRWAGKASTITYSNPNGGFDYIDLAFNHDYEHIKKIIAYSNPLLPAEFQWPKQFLWAGPSVSGIRTMIFLNLLRRFAPLWSLPENIFSPQTWLDNLNPNNWPIIMAPDAGFFSDTSMWTVMSTRFGNVHDVIAPTLKDAGLQITCDRWLPGDAQPFPSHAFLTKPTLILDVVDKSGVRGPTGTPLDGLLSLGQHILNDGVTEVIDVLDIGTPPEVYGVPGFLGTVTEWPWVSFRNGMNTGLSGISSWEMTVHKPLAGTVVTGGKSPSWVNSGLKLLLNFALGYLGAMFGNPGLALGIFDKQVEDVILAFHRVSLPTRQAQMGRGQYGEHWENTGGTGFSVSALQAIRIGLWKTRAYTSFKFELINGAPYWVNRHFELGDRVSGEVGHMSAGIGKLYVDQVHSVKISWSREQDPKWEISLGDGNAEDLPGALLSRQLEQVRALVQSLGVDS